ncbi:unnamed protein product [Arctia plantaginis]|uniref:NACHT domain-containing protein n=1 Tax=Arctia plantaginis TaxID=874455 RepID=A0A8S1A6F3_ARCPL|nr:unnamed protein product [Arctia plantaginis]
MFRKRQGTSAVHGHLYETKLLSLVLFKAQYDNNIREFYLATNIADIGVFDDICFKAKMNEDGPPLVVFIQAKHSKSTIADLNKKSNLLKYFNSYVKIKNKFDPATDDNIFNEDFKETECYFVVYTIAEGNKNVNNIENPLVLNSLIATGPVIAQPLYSENNVQFIAKIITAKRLAESFAKFLYDKYHNQCRALTDFENDIIIYYHVILAKEVVHVCEMANTHQRKCKFRDDFVNTTDPFLTMFRDHFYIEILKKQDVDKITQDTLLSEFLTRPAEDTLRPVIGRIILYDDGKFEFVQKHRSLASREELRQINLPEFTVKLAIKQAALNILQSSDMNFKVPITFGNIDIKVQNINNLTAKISYLLNCAVPTVRSDGKIIKLVTINETATDKILVLNRNLGSAVGNILIYDEGENLGNGYLKFIENNALLNPNAKTVLDKLLSKFKTLKEYRIDVKNLQLPKLTYDYVNEELTRDFLSKLVLYTDQASQSGVETILKELIQSRQITNTQNFRIKSEAIFLKYHDKIQSWWISSSEKVPYLTKTRNIYQETVDGIVNNSLITITSMMYVNKLKFINYTFNESAINSLSSSLDIFTKSELVGELPKLIIVTDSARLTVTKIMKILKNPFVVLDFQYILKILADDYHALISELESANIEDTFILVCDLDNFATSTENYRIHEKLKKIASLLEKKKKIIITNEIIIETVSKYFPSIDKSPCTELHSLVDFCPESRKYILENCQVLFQGQNISLNKIIGHDIEKLKSKDFIKGQVLHKIIFSKSIILGDSLADPNYISIKHLYIDRRLVRNQTTIELQTLHDVTGDVVILTGKPGMGKSTLLTHLSLKTKKLNNKLWIVKINLLDHSAELRDLKNKGAINILEILKFMCIVLLKIKKQNREISLNLTNLTISLNKCDGEVYIDEFSGDRWARFELEIFVHFYNKGHVVFLFDGFDEICPHYKETVIKLVNILKKDARNKKVDWSKWLPWPQVWITSRAYNELQSVLEHHFSAPYELEFFSPDQFTIYLEKFWQTNIIFSEFNKNIIDRIKLFLDNTSTKRIVNNFTLSRSLGKIHGSFIYYLIVNFPEIDGAKRWLNLYRTVNFLRQYVPKKTDTACDSPEVECPLLICLAATYFVTYLIHPDENDNDTNSFNIKASTVYEQLIEAVIKKHYVDKKKMNLDITYNIIDYESKLQMHKEVHKTIAAYVVFRNDIRNIFDKKQLINIDLFINTIKKGEEVTGLTCSVSNKVPQFIQITFAQYLAAEFLFDLLKRGNMKIKQRELLTSILYNQIDTFYLWLNHKLETNKHILFQIFNF